MVHPEGPILVDIFDRGDELVVEIALPGILETDINITLAGSRLMIHAERPPLLGESLLHEIPRGLLAREVDLPRPVELVHARYDEGLLTLFLREAP